MSEEKKSRSAKYKKDIDNLEKDIKEVKEETSSIKKVLFIILTIILLIGGYVKIIATKMFVVKENKIESTLIPESFSGLKIVHISDLHYGTTINSKELKKIVNMIDDYKPDIIFFTGNLIDKDINLNEDSKKEIIDLFNSLNPTLYKYAIAGNEDIDNDSFNDIINESGFKLLNNEATLLYYRGNDPIEIIGFDSIINDSNYSIIDESVNGVDTKNLYKIVLLHEPDIFNDIKDYNVNLVLAGHTLGGLINLPLYGPLIVPDNAHIYNKNYYNINDKDLYISNGLGTNSINIRLFNHPSLSLYRIYNK